MRLIVYDVEVFCEDWLVIFKDMETGKYTVVHNDNEELKQCISEDNLEGLKKRMLKRRKDKRGGMCDRIREI